MSKAKYIICFLSLSVLFLHSCGDAEKSFNDEYDRQAMLAFWADQIIIPAFAEYNTKLIELDTDATNFISNPSVTSLNELRESYILAAKNWQYVSMFDIGKAEEIGLRNYSNIFPTNESEIESNITANAYDLSLPSNFDAQGLPALDYLLFGSGSSDAEILNFFSVTSRTNYLKALTQRLVELTTMVLNDWNSSFRETFVSNDGSSAISSVDKLTNDFLLYYEKFFRAGKIGIPAGIFSGNIAGEKVEAPYSGQYSKMLFEESLKAIQKFYQGISFDGTVSGPSLRDYTDYATEITGVSNISSRVLNGWDIVEEKIQELDADFKNQIENDNGKMLETYDEIQKVVVILKVDMMQALCIQVDFVDADGD